MKFSTKITLLFLSASVLLSGCVSTTVINSEPSGAMLYADSERLGKTPYTYSDTKIVGSQTVLTFKLDGYKNKNVVLQRNERADAGAIVAGVFVYVPFLWCMRYHPVHNYELEPDLDGNTKTPATAGKLTPENSNNGVTSNSTNELVKLKNLLDQGAITEDDFTTLKVKILNDEYEYNNSIADQLVKLKGLKDQGLLTDVEFLSQKNKLINPK